MAVEKPLHFVVLLGSLRRGSYNAAIARALPALAPPDVTITPLGSVGDFPLYDADEQAAGFPPAVVAMGEAIGKSDGVIIVTPEYNYSMPGVLKNAIDWISRLTDQPFQHKPVAIQSGSMGGYGGVRAQMHLRQSLVYLNTRTLGLPEVMIPVIQNKVDASTGELTDEASRKFIAHQLQTFAAFVRH
jgi:chromate reductase